MDVESRVEDALEQIRSTLQSMQAQMSLQSEELKAIKSQISSNERSSGKLKFAQDTRGGIPLSAASLTEPDPSEGGKRPSRERWSALTTTKDSEGTVSVQRRGTSASTSLSEKDVAKHLQPWKYKASTIHSVGGVLNPDGKFRVCWDILLSLLLMYLAVMVPIEIGFDPSLPVELIAFNICLDFIFIFDILLNFRTGYSVQKRYVWDKALVAKRYLSTWFLPDLLSSIPVQLILLVMGDGSRASDRPLLILKMVRLLKLGRLSRFGRLK